MCGIVGAAGEIYKSGKDAFEDMLVFSQVRGPHSTGIASVDRHKNEVEIIKCIGRPHELIEYDKRYDKVVSFGKKFMLGHNRWATTGHINKRNAHPFLFDNIVGCHNGTIPPYILSKLKKSTGYGTDSETVLSNINEYPLKDVIKHLEAPAAAYAFVWYDVRDNTVNIIRNKERSLYYTYSEDRKSLFWASEKGFLQAALARNNIKFDKIYDVTEDMHFKWVIPEYNGKFLAPNQVKCAPDKKVIPLYGHTFHRHSHADQDDWEKLMYGAYDNDDGDVLRNGAKETQPKFPLVCAHGANQVDGAKTPPVKDFASPDHLKDFDKQGYIAVGKGKRKHHTYRGFGGTRLTETEFKAKTKNGCAWCEEPAQWGKPVRFLGPDSHICMKCNSDDGVSDVVTPRKAS